MEYFGNGAAEKYVYYPRRRGRDLLKFLKHEIGPIVRKRIENSLRLARKYGLGLKFHVELQIEYVKIVTDENGDYQERFSEPWFVGETVKVLLMKDIDDSVTSSLANLAEKSEIYLHNGSGWLFRKTLKFHLVLMRFKPFSAGNDEGGRTRLPSFILIKRACKSVRFNSDCSKCFLHCLYLYRLAKKTKGSVLLRATKEGFDRWEKENSLDTSCLSFPTRLSQIEAFERRNGIAINVYEAVCKKNVLSSAIRILQISNHLKTLKEAPTEVNCVDLLYHEKHFFLIRYLSRLVGGRGKKHICRSCLCAFRTNRQLREHWDSGCSKTGQVYVIPERPEKRRIVFDNYSARIPRRDVIYYDFETALVPESADDGKTSKHVPIAVGAKRICHTNWELNSELLLYTGEDCVGKFLDWLEEEKQNVLFQINCQSRDLEMKPDDYAHFLKQDACQLCGSKFDGFKQPYRDHDHCNGKYRMALCNRCNLTYASEKDIKIVCMAHYSSHYDQHLFIKEMVARSRKAKRNPPRVLPQNSEHYKAIFDGMFIFLDSCEFLQSSLDTVVESVKLSKRSTQTELVSSFPLLLQYVGGNKEKYNQLSKKGVLCYEYIDGMEKLREKELPSRSKFYDHLKQKEISREEYARAKTVWKTMKCQCLEDYLRVYLMCDVLLLADCFENFRKVCFKNFSLDPARFLSLPHMAWHALLLHTGVEIEIVPSADMYFFIKRGIRGGVASIMHRFVDGINIPEMGEKYMPNKPRKEIASFDCTNLYGLALCKSLPLKNYRWLSELEISTLKTEYISEYSKIGYILSVDLEYPKGLHEEHDMFPLCPEKVNIPPSEWSNFNLLRGADLGDFKSTEKLIPHLKDRHDYVIHGEHLKFCLKHGLVLKKIRKVLAFDQSHWLAPFVNFVTELRKNASSEFEDSIWKKVVNASYGRLLMDKEKHINMKLVTNEMKFYNETRKPTLKTVTFYDKHLVGVQHKPRIITLDKPIAVGFSCLELSKLHIYKFHYGYIKPMYGKDCQLLVTDTDSLTYVVENHNVDRDIWANRKYFDLSKYPKESPMWWEKNKKLRGTFKREYPDRPIVAFVGLRAKMYAFSHLSKSDKQNDETRKAKGIPRSVLNNMRFDDYKKALFEHQVEKKSFVSIRSKKHKLQTIRQEKIGLSNFDTKRWVCDDGVKTFAYGHYRLCQQ